MGMFIYSGGARFVGVTGGHATDAKIVGLFPVPPAWLVVIMVVGFPSADVTSFRMVPGGKWPFVYEIRITLKLRLFQIIINVSVSET